MTSLTSVAMTTFPASFANNELVERVAANLATVHARIVSCGRELDSVRVVAVTKTFGPEMVRAAYDVGLRSVGENYVDEMVEKRTATSDLALTWYFMGALQSNKIARALEVADVLCGVARVKELDKISTLRPAASIYVQVDCTGAQQRNGAAVSEVSALVSRGRELGLDVRGLMTVAPTTSKDAREAFHITRQLADELGLAERSMGMSDDLELACEYGTTEVRIGRALFGPRSAL
jgi:pyridoxal phosphate enzyme (YggS family)